MYTYTCFPTVASCVRLIIILNHMLLLGYSLSQQPDTEHLSILRRECHGPDVTHRLLNGTWLRSV